MNETRKTSEVFDNPFRTSRLNHSSDFKPEWDVESLNAAPSKWLLEEIGHISGRREADPGQLIPVILSQPGYGKTHILGRLGNALGENAFFVFVGAVPDPRRLLDHVRYTTVETLFQESHGKPSFLTAALATLFHSSFVEHAVRYCTDADEKRMLLEKLEGGVSGVLEVIGKSTSQISYQKLAESVAARIPQVRASVMRALALGWSPRKHLSRQWLRGEKLSEDDARRIGIHDESPNAVDVLNGIVAILEYKKPIVICFDQIESTLKDSEGPKHLAIQLMELLAAVPNQFLLISCFNQAWKDSYRPVLSPAFLRRTKEYELKFPSAEHAMALVRKRLETLANRDAKADAFWPFDATRLENFIRQETPMPAELIKRCAAAMDAWMAGEAKAPLTISEEIQTEQSVPQLFAARWNEELQNVGRDPRRQPDEMQDARIFSAMKEMVALAKSAGAQWPGLNVSAVKESVLASTPAYPRYGMRVEVADPAGTHSVIAGVTTMTGGNGLFYFVREMGKAIKTAAGGVLLHPRGEFNLGQVGANTVAKLKAEKKLVILFLKEHRPTYAAMECALGLLEQSRSGELVLGSESISYEHCQQLLRETKVLDDLHFFKVLAQWNATASNPPVSPAKEVTRRTPAASRAAAAI